MDRAKQREYLLRQQETYRIMEDMKRMELAQMSEEKAERAIEDVLDLASDYIESRPSSGLVNWQEFACRYLEYKRKNPPTPQ